MQNPFGVVGAFGVARNFGTQNARRVGVIGIAVNLHRYTVLHGGKQRAGIRTIVWASAEDGGGCNGGSHPPIMIYGVIE